MAKPVTQPLTQPLTRPLNQPPARVARCDDNARPTAEQKPLPEAISGTPLEEKSAARWAYERLILYIQNFEEQLDNEHEVAMGFTGGDAGVLRIEGLGFFDPDIVTFYGRDPSGAKTQFIQHVSQLNVMLRALPREDPSQQAPNRIGFRLARDLGAEPGVGSGVDSDAMPGETPGETPGAEPAGLSGRGADGGPGPDRPVD